MLTANELGCYLQQARKHLRLSQTAVAGHLGVARQGISAYESGKRSVSSHELQILCNLFRIYPNDLLGFETEARDETLSRSLDFRFNTGIFALSDNDQREIRDMTASVPPDNQSYLMRWKNSFKQFGVDRKKPFWSMVDVAQNLRNGLGQVAPPINIFLIVEQLGIYLKPTFLDKAAAIVNRPNESRQCPPWILVSSTQPIDRQRYSIAHEIAHLLLHEEELLVHHPHYYRRHFDRREIDAESFAAELLMPHELIKKSVGQWEVNKPLEEAVFLLSYLYQVSFTAMSKRVYELKLVTRSTYEDLCKVKPSKLEGAARKTPAKHLFRAEAFIPKITEELGISPAPRSFDRKAVRRMQEMAYTRYLGLQTSGGSNPAVIYQLESAGRVYEKVAIWIALNYPLYGTHRSTH
jgi:Zn-dependent peptidase ImmA (M78 family)/transcriptional regulator with XRE-family HTH domain